MLSTIVGVGCVGFFFLSLMFKTTIILWIKLIATLLTVIKWLFIVGFVVAFLNMPQMYIFTGWTPISAIFGSQVYERQVQKLASVRHKKSNG